MTSPTHLIVGSETQLVYADTWIELLGSHVRTPMCDTAQRTVLQREKNKAEKNKAGIKRIKEHQQVNNRNSNNSVSVNTYIGCSNPPRNYKDAKWNNSHFLLIRLADKNKTEHMQWGWQIARKIQELDRHRASEVWLAGCWRLSCCLPGLL